jgi:hypothetical protein
VRWILWGADTCQLLAESRVSIGLDGQKVPMLTFSLFSTQAQCERHCGEKLTDPDS